MRIPRLSHIQFMILVFLQARDSTGKEIRGALDQAGVRRSGPGFYQIMSRLEDAGFIRGEYQQDVVAGQIIRERRYQITAGGRRSCRDSRDFYQEWIGRLGHGGVTA